MLIKELDLLPRDDPSNISAQWISWQPNAFCIQLCRSTGHFANVLKMCMGFWPGFYYCLQCTCGSVDFKRGRHVGTDGGQVGQLRHSSVPSSHRCHLNPNWKDNTPQHNAFCTYSCCHHRQSNEKNKNLLYFYSLALFSISNIDGMY